MASYDLTELAAEDFERIFEFGIDVFGLESALFYQKQIETQFDIITNNSFHYQEVSHILSGVRMSPYKAHTIYYKIKSSSHVTVLRILGKQSAESALK